MKLLVRSSWRSSLLTRVRIRRSRGSPNSSAVTRQGPMGLKVSKLLAVAICRSRIAGHGALLNIAGRYVVDDGETSDVLPCVDGADICAISADHDGNLAFIVDLCRGSLRQTDWRPWVGDR